MSFPTAQNHLESALSHVKSGNAAKAMHHIGHAMNQLRPMTVAVSGPSKIKQAPQQKAKPVPPPSAGDAPGAGLRGRLAGMNQSGGAPDTNGGY